MSRALIVDCETTGPPDDIPIQVAWAEVEEVAALRGPPQVARFNPGCLIPAGAMGVHHMTDALVAGFPPWSSDWCPHTEDGESIEAEYLIAHNVDYDWKALGRPDCKRIDTLALARSLWPEADNHKLTTLCYHITPRQFHGGLDWLKGSHDAETDLNACLLVFRRAVDLLGLDSFGAIWLASEAARVPKAMMFGKHKGLPMAQVPRDYKDWLLRQPDVDPYLRQALEAR